MSPVAVLGLHARERTVRFCSSLETNSSNLQRSSRAESRVRPTARARASSGRDATPGVGGGTARVALSQRCRSRLRSSRLAALTLPLLMPSIVQATSAPCHDTSTAGGPKAASRYLSNRETHSAASRWRKQGSIASREDRHSFGVEPVRVSLLALSAAHRREHASRPLRTPAAHAI